MEEVTRVQSGNMLQIKLKQEDQQIRSPDNLFASVWSPEYVINDSVTFIIRVDSYVTEEWEYGSDAYTVFIKFAKVQQYDELSYTLRINSKVFCIEDLHFAVQASYEQWHLLYQDMEHHTTFDMTINLDVGPITSPFAALHQDEVLTDFKLRGEDGSVPMHRAILATSSPVLKKLLEGSWREMEEGQVAVPGISKTTLQHLKDYIYLQSLPDVDLEQLLLLSSYYALPKLEQKCIRKLVKGTNNENACALFEFACTHELQKLLLALLESVKKGEFDLEDIRNYLKEPSKSNSDLQNENSISK